MRWLGAMLLGALASVPAPAQPADAELRMWGDARAPDGDVVSVDTQGVRVIATNGSSTTLGWDVVRDVVGEHADAFEPLRDRAGRVWRASARLDRDDHVNAEPLFESLFEEYHAQSGPTSSIVARGLLECRLRSGGVARAVSAWLGVLRAENWTPERVGQTPESALIDPATGLSPRVPPIWLGDDAAEWLARSGPGWDVPGSVEPGSLRDRLRVLEGLFVLSARRETGDHDADGIRRALEEIVSGVDARAMREPGVQLVFEIVASRVGTPESRASSRAALESRLRPDQPRWQEAWTRAALGRSLLLEDDTETRRRGIVQLLHVPARLADVAPELAALCLAEAAVASRAVGEDGDAETLLRQLLESYPASRAARWAPIRERSSPSLGRAQKPAFDPDPASEDTDAHA